MFVVPSNKNTPYNSGHHWRWRKAGSQLGSDLAGQKPAATEITEAQGYLAIWPVATSCCCLTHPRPGLWVTLRGRGCTDVSPPHTHWGAPIPTPTAFPFPQGAILTRRHLRKVIIARLISNRPHHEGLPLCGINFKTSGFDVSGKEPAWDSHCCLLLLLASAGGLFLRR